MSTDPQRKIATLLTVLVALVGLLVAALGVGAVVVLRKLDRASAPAKLEQTVDELTARQRTAAARLDDVADQTERAIGALEKRGRALNGVDSGPMDKMAQMIALQQLMVDEMLTLLRHVAASQSAIASALRPLPIQREERHDVSGSDKEDREKPRAKDGR